MSVSKYKEGDKVFIVSKNVSGTIKATGDGCYIVENSDFCLPFQENDLVISRTEFEKALLMMIQSMKNLCQVTDKISSEDCEGIMQQHRELVLTAAKKELEIEIYNKAYAEGRESVLNALPKWHNIKREWDSITEHLYKGLYIDLEEVYKTLPHPEEY